MSSRIAVMDKGRILQVGRPHDIYEYPADRFVADFIGNANLFEGIAAADGIRVDGLELPLAVEQLPTAGAAAAVLVRPEKIVMAREAAANADTPPRQANVLAGEVVEIGYHGDVSSYRVRLGSGRLVLVTAANLRHAAEPAIGRGDRVVLSWHPGNAVVLP